MQKNYILEPAQKIPVEKEVDICVIGGSCTGVFAAVRAARLGAKVAVIEKQNSFGGVAASGFIHIWHSLYDNLQQQKIISGLTEEVLDSLGKLGVLIDKQKELRVEDKSTFYFNSEELKIELDQLVLSHEILPYLHTQFAGSLVEDGRIKAVFIQNKNGRSAIKAKVFIDASGDGDLAVSSGLKYYYHEFMQPPTACCKLIYNEKEAGLEQLILRHGEEFGLGRDRGWYASIPGNQNFYMKALTHVFHVDCCDANQLTFAEMEGRRQIRAYMNLARKYYGGEITLAGLCSGIGIRETRQIRCEYRLTREDVTEGRKFEDAVANSSYPIDIHNPDGTMEIYGLSGTIKKILLDGTTETGRWREAEGSPAYYQIPYRCMINRKMDNLIVAGRMIDMDSAAFSSARVMVNTNQLGEAAGVAAYMAVKDQKPVYDVDIAKLRALLQNGGSII